MIDHVSIPVSDICKSERFYTALLSVLGYQLLDKKDGTVGYGKKYPDFWLNERKNILQNQVSDGFHVCLRAKSADIVDQFHDIAIKNGAISDGGPALRPQHGANYYAAFIKDFDSNRIEVVTFL